MLPEERDAAYLFDMLQASEKVRRYVTGKSFETFRDDDQLRDSVERNIQIIGEAARRVSPAFKEEHPDIPWRKIIAQRNVLVHEYENIGMEEMWEVATAHIPLLIKQLQPLIPPIPPV
jgi:uncharacterized protein with HEPN domain